MEHGRQILGPDFFYLKTSGSSCSTSEPWRMTRVVAGGIKCEPSGARHRSIKRVENQSLFIQRSEKAAKSCAVDVVDLTPRSKAPDVPRNA